MRLACCLDSPDLETGLSFAADPHRLRLGSRRSFRTQVATSAMCGELHGGYLVAVA